MPSTTANSVLQSDKTFVSGIVAGERPSAKMSSSTPQHESASKSFIPLQNLENSQDARAGAPLRDAGDGKIAIADVTDGEFEPVWGAEAKPRSQREIFLAEQSFAQGKQQGEEEASKRAHAEGFKEGRESGYKQGFQDGEKERLGEIEQRAEERARQITDKRIEALAVFFEQLMQREQEASHKRDTELMALMMAIFDKILPALAQENGEKEVQFFLKAILQRFENIPQITITLADDAQGLVSQLRERVAMLLSDDKNIDTLVSFQFDPSFSKADCKIAWAEGEVERRFHSLWQEVKQALQQHLPSASRETDEMTPKQQGQGEREKEEQESEELSEVAA